MRTSLQYGGRDDQQIKLRGHRIELGEIEAQLLAAGARECVVQAQRGEGEGEGEGGETRLVAYVVPASLDLGAVRAALRAQLPAAVVPTAYVGLAVLPRMLNGKVDRQALPEAGVGAGGPAYVAPRTKGEALVARVYAEVLRVSRVGVHDDFFDLGGHSLLATQLVAQLANDAAGRVSSTPSVRGAHSGSGSRGVARGDAVGSARRSYPTQAAAAVVWARAVVVFGSLEPEPRAYNLTFALRLCGTLSVEALEATLLAIVARHEALRTTFREVDGMAVQAIAIAATAALPLVCVEVSTAAAPE